MRTKSLKKLTRKNKKIISNQ